jgi:hypothetical protein
MLTKNETKIKRLIYTVSIIQELLEEFNNENNNAIVKLAIVEVVNIKNEKLIKQAKNYGIHLVIEKEVSKNDYDILHKMLVNYLAIASK